MSEALGQDEPTSEPPRPATTATGADPSRLALGTGADAREIAYLRRPGVTPGVFWWTVEFRSDMMGNKATALNTSRPPRPAARSPGSTILATDNQPGSSRTAR